MTLFAQVYYTAKKPRMYRTFHTLMSLGSVGYFRNSDRRDTDYQLAEIGGYATRLFSHYKPFNLAAFIASFSMIVMV
jgi:hypothetical protein